MHAKAGQEGRSGVARQPADPRWLIKRKRPVRNVSRAGAGQLAGWLVVSDRLICRFSQNSLDAMPIFSLWA
jgi:hypothetical protein